MRRIEAEAASARGRAALTITFAREHCGVLGAAGGRAEIEVPLLLRS
jgi:hypothetical protein